MFDRDPLYLFEQLLETPTRGEMQQRAKMNLAAFISRTRMTKEEEKAFLPMLREQLKGYTDASTGSLETLYAERLKQLKLPLQKGEKIDLISSGWTKKMRRILTDAEVDETKQGMPLRQMHIMEKNINNKPVVNSFKAWSHFYGLLWYKDDPLKEDPTKEAKAIDYFRALQQAIDERKKDAAR